MLTSTTAAELRAHKAELSERIRVAAGGAPRVSAVATTPTARGIPAHANVLGVGLGAKVTGGHIAADVAVRVYVRAKLPRGELRAQELIPEVVDGVPTDVVEVGDVALLGQPAAAESRPSRPVRCGVSIGHVDSTAGTLGCLVARGDDTDHPYILSNNHVLANVNEAEVGDAILQPGPADGGTEPIAELSEYEPIELAGEANIIDAAVARLLDPADVEPEIEVIGPPGTQSIEAALYASVRKHGRTTRHTVGVVMDVSVDLWVRVTARDEAWFEDQLGVVGVQEAFSEPGDSGSLVVDAVTRAPVGLLFAGGRGHTFCNPIDAVLDRFDATIIGERTDEARRGGGGGPAPVVR